jgi:hypothetical protein
MFYAVEMGSGAINIGSGIYKLIRRLFRQHGLSLFYFFFPK